MTEPAMNFSLQWPGKVIFGAGVLARLGEEARAWGSHAFVVTTPDLARLGWSEGEDNCS